MIRLLETKNVLIIGHFGGKNNFTDGQTVKTKILYEQLIKYTNWHIDILDTYYKKNKIVFLFNSLFKISKNKVIIVLLSGNGMKTFFPILFVFSKIFNKKVFHDVIGGNLHTYVDDEINFKKYLNSFCENWVETRGMAKLLNDRGIKNTRIIPNFRESEKIELKVKKYKNILYFCTFSRVNKEKGISEAILSIKEINQFHKGVCCYLDIYGPVDANYKEEFEKLISENLNYVSYKGNISQSKAISVLKKYDFLLFPTRWKGEGQAGTIIESFFAGLPVIASDWMYNSEMVSHKVNGLIYPNTDINNLVDAINWVINNSRSINNMKQNALIESSYYLPEKHILKIKNIIEDFI